MVRYATQSTYFRFLPERSCPVAWVCLLCEASDHDLMFNMRKIEEKSLSAHLGTMILKIGNPKAQGM